MADASDVVDGSGPRLHYLEWRGGGPPVLCLPGITANAHAFAGLAEELSPRRRVVAMDLRGRGESDKPATGYDVVEHVGDVVRLLDGLGIGCASAIGWSLGGRVALALAALHPDAVDRLVLIDPPVETSDAAASVLRGFWERLDNTYASIDEFLARMRDSWTFTDWSPYVERYLRADVVAGPDGVARHRIPRHVPEAELRAERRFPTRSFYARVRCPVLILRSTRPIAEDGDEVLSATDAAEMADALGDAVLVDVPGVNHFGVVLGKPPRTLAAIAAFLGGLGEPTTPAETGRNAL